jgi:cytochrome c
VSRYRRRFVAFAASVLLSVSLLTAGPTPAVAEPAIEAYSVLVFSKTAGFRHDSIEEGIAAIQQLGAANGFTVVATEDSANFTDAYLSQFATVIWLSTTGDVLNEDQQAAFQRYIQAGGGYTGVHAASDTEYSWAWYGELVGAYFSAHPQNQQATIKVEDPAHPSTAGLPAEWSRFDEWYNFQTNPRGDVHVLASLDETTYSPGGGAMGSDHPTAWCHDYDGGRSWYTGSGHTAESYVEPQFLEHLLGGIETTAGVADADCSATVEGSFEKITLDTNTQNPMELDIAPDGRVFYIERDGRVQIIKPDTGLTVTAADLDVFTGNEDGLIGIRLDPDFATNGWVYLYYAPNGGGPRNLLSRFTVTEDTLDLASESVVIQVDTQRNTCCHAGGSMVFDGDGNIYLATGDNTNPFESSSFTPIDERPGRADFDAQRSSGNTNDLRGKILRVNPLPGGGYSIPAGNLFPPGTAQTRPEIFAMGFRNPFRIGIDPLTDTLVVGDYGPDAGAPDPNRGPEGTVEWNIVTPGNYGWPYCHGANYAYNDYPFPSGPSGAPFNCAAPVNNSPNNTGLTNLPPAISATIDYDYSGNALYPEIGGGGAPMGGPVYRYSETLVSDTKWPAYFDGKAMFGEWNQNKMYTFQLSSDARSVVDINNLLSEMTFLRPMDFEFGPDGALYLIEWGSGFGGNNDNSGIYRLDYVAGERAPIAVASGDPASGQAPLTVQFSSAGSRDPDGQEITFSWAFGDGATSTQANPTHTYTTAGNFTAQLTVTDSAGRSSVANVPITVGNTAPTVRIDFPPEGGFFNWGDQVRYTVTVTDPEDGTIDCSRVTLQYYLGHDLHAHPLQSYTGCEGVVQTSLASGHGADANVFAVFEATYTDNGGTGGSAPLTGRSIEQLQPKRKQAEYYTEAGRTPDGLGAGDPGVVKETTGDTQGGFQNLGFIEDGDFWSFDPANLTNVDSFRFRAASGGAGGRLFVHSGSATGPVLAVATIPPTAGWQVYTDVTVDLGTPSTTTGPLFFVARNNEGVTTGDGLFNVNWVDFLGRGVTDNAPPVITASANPSTGVAPVEITFSGSATDEEGDLPLTYAWDFGDGSGATTPNAVHTYTAAGNYTATLTVTDSRGAASYATVPVTITAPNTSCFGARSDDFGGNTLSRDRWSTIVRENQSYSVAGGSLLLPTAVGDLYGARNDASNLVLQPTPGTVWQATTKLTLATTADYQQAGILLYGDDDNYAKVNVLFAGNRRVEFIRETAGVPRNEAGDSTNAPAGDTIYVRMTSDGTNLNASYSSDGQNFTPVGRVAALAGIATPKIGLFAINGGTAAPVVNAAFDWFQITPDETATPEPSDEFDASTLDKCRWNAIVREDAAAYRITGGGLEVDISNGDIYGTGNTGPTNFILQNAPDGDWTLETKVDGSAMNEQYQQAGLIVYGDDDNYLKLDYITDNVAGQPLLRRIEFRSEVAGVAQNPQPEAGNLTSAVWHLRLAKEGDVYTASYSSDGVTWASLAPLTSTAVSGTPKIGLFSLGANQTASQSVTFGYFRVGTSTDEEAPVTTAAVSGPSSNGWYTGTATVTLTATDASGVASTQYQLDAATEWTAYTEPVSVSGDGVHTVRFRSTDLAGNVEETKSIEVKIDTTAPVTVAAFAPPSGGGWHNGAVPVTLTATDAGSGVAGVEWSLDGGPWTAYSGAIPVTGNGQHELLYRSTDVAGNAETLKSAILKIDGNAPTVIVSGLAHGQLYGDSQDVRVTFQAADPLSGIASTIGTLDGQAFNTGTLQALFELDLGLHELVVTATDNAGNVTSTTVTFFVTTSFRDMQFLLDRFKATSWLTNRAHKQLSAKLANAREAEAAGNDRKAINQLRALIALAQDTTLVPNAEVRAVVIRDAEAMIVRLGGTASANGLKLNGGKGFDVAGRLAEDPTRITR